MKDSTHLAIDIGASGGRCILGWLYAGKLLTEEVHRFPNGMVQINGQYCWDIDNLFAEIIIGLKKCKELGKIPASVGIDTWGVDFVLLDDENNLVGPAVAYRDNRSEGMDLEVNKFISESELYSRNGIQKIFFNTIYQLMGIKVHTPQYLDRAVKLLFLPDYLHYKLSGVKKTEYTIASTSGLLNAKEKVWDDEIISRCGFPRELFCEIVPAGTVLGGFTPEIINEVGYFSKVIMPPSHDTASAFLAVPAKSERSVYISSGTWSLMGVEITEPITTEDSRIENFTNEGGFNYRYRFLKNIAGLWLLQSVHKEIGNGISYSDLVELARKSDCDCIFDVNDERLAAPESMIDAIKDACRLQCQHCSDSNVSLLSSKLPETLGDYARSIFLSLAHSYFHTIESLKKLTGTKYDSINIIGGGSLNNFLNQLTVQACNLPVYAGPAEGTALGNIASQMIAMGVLSDYKAARTIIRQSFDVRKV